MARLHSTVKASIKTVGSICVLLLIRALSHELSKLLRIHRWTKQWKRGFMVRSSVMLHTDGAFHSSTNISADTSRLHVRVSVDGLCGKVWKLSTCCQLCFSTTLVMGDTERLSLLLCLDLLSLMALNKGFSPQSDLLRIKDTLRVQ